MPLARTLTITYGGTTFGDTDAGYILQGVYVTERDYNSLTVRFQVLVQHNTIATFHTKCATLETAMRTPNSNLKVTWNLTDVIDLSHSGNTGMNARGSARKVGSAADSDRSRLYDCSVTVMLPADEAGKNGRRSAEVRISQDGAEGMHLAVTATYIASAGVTALSQAQTNFPTYVGTLQTAAGGVWDEADGIAYSYDVENKVCTATAAYTEILAAQSQSATNDTTLQGVWTEVTTDRVGIGADPGGSAPLIKITVRLFARVRSSQSTDILDVYENRVRPHIIAIAQTYSPVNKVTAILDRPGLRPQDNSISARMVFMSEGSNSLVRADTNIARISRLPRVFIPVLDGSDYGRDEHKVPGFKGALVASSVLVIGQDLDGPANAFGLHDETVKMLQDQGYKVTERQQPTQKLVEFEGLDGLTSPLRMIAVSRSTLLEYAPAARVASGSGGGRGNRVGATRVRGRGGGGGGEWIDRLD